MNNTSTPLWSELKAGISIDTDENNVVYLHVSKKITRDKPSLIISRGKKSLDGIRYFDNIVLPSNKKDLEALLKNAISLLPTLDTKTTTTAPIDTTEEKSLSVKMVSDILEGIKQLGKNQQSITTRLNNLESKKK